MTSRLLRNVAIAAPLMNWQEAPEQHPVEATQSPADPVGVLFDELVHARDQDSRNSAVQPSVGRGVVESARAAALSLTRVQSPWHSPGPGRSPALVPAEGPR